MTKYLIGKNVETNEDVFLDLQTLIETRLSLQASSGLGKSYAIRKLLEITHGHVQQIVLDWEGEFGTLREKFDYILLGQDGDVAIEVRGAGILAKKLLELNTSAIINLYGLTRSNRIRFVKLFLDGLIDAPKKLWHPCIIVVDEAHQLAPQAGKSESLNSVIDLATMGRKREFCCVLATQRFSKLDKDATAELRNGLFGGTVQSIDRKRAFEELGFTTKEEMQSLREIKTGEFFAFGPAISPTEVIKIKIGSVVTTHHIKKGQKKGLVATPTTKVKAVLSKLADLPQKVEEELRSKEDYLRKIRALKIELRKKPKTELDARGMEQIKNQLTRESDKSIKGRTNQFNQKLKETHRDYEGQLTAATKEFNQTLKQTHREHNGQLNVANTIINQLSVGIKQIATTTKSLIAIPLLIPKSTSDVKWAKEFTQRIDELGKPKERVLDTPTAERTPHRKNPQAITTAPTFSPELSGDIQLNKCEKQTYSVLYNNPTISLSKPRLAFLSGYSHKTGAFLNALSHLATLSLIERIGGKVSVKEGNTTLGQKLLGDAVDFSEEITADTWKKTWDGKKLKKPELAIYNFLLENQIPIIRDDLAGHVNYSPLTGSFLNALSRLSTLELIKREGMMVELNEEVLI